MTIKTVSSKEGFTNLNILSFDTQFEQKMGTLTLSWLIMDIGCLAIVLSAKFKNLVPSFLGDLMVYGKNRQLGQNNSKESLHWLRQLLLVPNRWFTHFYAFGFVWNIFLLGVFVRTIIKEDTFTITSTSSQTDCFSVLFPLILLTIQVSRRLYESLFVSSFSGKMHLGHYVLGLLFYFLVNLTVAAEVPPSLSKDWYKSCLKPSHQASWLQFVALLLFLWASYHQYQCHTILSKLTAWTADGRKIYKIPHGDWFNHVSSPHYLAEIVIYIALFLAMKGQSFRWILTIIFVVSNLTFGAQNTHLWYKQKFEDYPKHRYIILPYVY